MRTLVTILLVLLTAVVAALPNLVLWNPGVHRAYAYDLRSLHSSAKATDGESLRAAFQAVYDPNFYTRPLDDPPRYVLELLLGDRPNEYGGSPISYGLSKLILANDRHFPLGERLGASEAMIFRLEHELAKDEILDGYIRRARFGLDSRGVQSAAAYYFDKSPEALSTTEVIYLIALEKRGGCKMPRFVFDGIVARLVAAGLLDAEQAKLEADRAATLSTVRDRPGCAARG